MTTESRELKSVSVDLLDEPSEPIRKLASERGMEELRRSVAARGVLVPLIVVAKGDRFEVVAGLRRLLAARATGVVQVPCVVMEDERAARTWAMWAENRIREGINALDEARWLSVILEEERVPACELAQRLGVSESWLSQHLAILLWPPDVRTAVGEGWLSFAVARELAGIKGDQERRQALRMAKVSGCTARQAADWRRQYDKASGLVQEPGGGLTSELPGGTGGQVETRCELCSEDVRERDQRLLILCPTCHKAVASLRESYTSQGTPQGSLFPTFPFLPSFFSPTTSSPPLFFLWTQGESPCTPNLRATRPPPGLDAPQMPPLRSGLKVCYAPVPTVPTPTPRRAPGVL